MIRGQMTNGSTTLNAGQTLKVFGANPNRKGLIIQNVDAAASLSIGIGAAEQLGVGAGNKPGFMLFPAASAPLILMGPSCPEDDIVLWSVASCAFTALEMA